MGTCAYAVACVMRAGSTCASVTPWHACVRASLLLQTSILLQSSHAQPCPLYMEFRIHQKHACRTHVPTCTFCQVYGQANRSITPQTYVGISSSAFGQSRLLLAQVCKYVYSIAHVQLSASRRLS
eukprot:6198177-Pleurochrysis_carterae.AAC.2